MYSCRGKAALYSRLPIRLFFRTITSTTVPPSKSCVHSISDWFNTDNLVLCCVFASRVAATTNSSFLSSGIFLCLVYIYIYIPVNYFVMAGGPIRSVLVDCWFIRFDSTRTTATAAASFPSFLSLCCGSCVERCCQISKGGSRPVLGMGRPFMTVGSTRGGPWTTMTASRDPSSPRPPRSSSCSPVCWSVTPSCVCGLFLRGDTTGRCRRSTAVRSAEEGGRTCSCWLFWHFVFRLVRRSFCGTTHRWCRYY